MAALSEQEEFEFRARAEAEAKTAQTTESDKVPNEEQSLAQKAGKAVVEGADTAAEFAFGKGPERNIETGERAKRIATAAVTTGLLGGGIGMFGGPAGAAIGATGGMLAGATGEIAEQLSSYYGAGRAEQVLYGLGASTLASAPAQFLIKAAPEIAGKLFPPGLRKIFTGREESPKVTAAVEEARSKMVGEGFQAAGDVGTAVQTKEAERAARAAELRARAEKSVTGEQTALRQQQDIAKQELEVATEKGPGKTRSEYDLGTEVRQEIEAVKDPIAKQMQTEYRADRNAAMTEAAKNEAKGIYWSEQPQAQAIKNKWEGIAENSSKDVQASIKKVLNEVWAEPPVKVQYGFGETASQVKKRASANTIDEIVRKLGNIGYTGESEGYKALGKDVARNLRSDITKGLKTTTAEGTEVRSGGFYDWSGLGPAKGKYAASMKEMAKYETTRGEAALGGKVDTEKLPKNFFGTQSGFNEIKGMLPSEKVEQYATQYAHNELAGKDVTKTRKWAEQHSFLVENSPGVKQSVNDHLNTISSLKDKAEGITTRLAEVGEKRWSAAVDAVAQKEAKVIAAQPDPEQAILGIFKGTKTRKQLEAVSKYLNDDPVSRAKFPDAVAYHISKFKTTNPKGEGGILNEIQRLEPALLGSGLMTESQIKTLTGQAQKIIKASKSPEKAKEGIVALIKRTLKTQAVGSALSGTALEQPSQGQEE